MKLRVNKIMHDIIIKLLFKVTDTADLFKYKVFMIFNIKIYIYEKTPEQNFF